MRTHKNLQTLAFSAIATLFLCFRVFAAGCPGIGGGTGDWYNVGLPLLNITYNSADGKIYSTEDFGAGEVLQFDLGTVNVVGANSYPYDIITNPATGLMYISLRQANGIRVMNTSGSTVTTIAGGNNPFGMAISSLTKRLYVANASANTVTVVDLNPALPSYHSVIKTITVGGSPQNIAIDDSVGYGRVYVSNRDSYSLSVISETTMKVVGVVPITHKPGDIAVNTTTHKIYVVNPDGNFITVINGVTLPGTVQTTMTFGSDPWGIAVNPNTNHIFITDYTGQTVTVVNHDNPPDGTLYSTVRVDAFTSPLRGITVDPATDYYYAAANDGYSSNGLAGCTRIHLDTCIDMRSHGLVNDADVEAFLDCYFKQH